jgi:hypothetical protein
VRRGADRRVSDQLRVAHPGIPRVNGVVVPPASAFARHAASLGEFGEILFVVRSVISIARAISRWEASGCASRYSSTAP